MKEREEKAFQILLTMFEVIEKATRRPSRECFNTLVRFLADCCRIHPLPKEDHPVAAQL